MEGPSIPPALSTPDTHIFDYTTTVPPASAAPKLSDAQLRIRYEIDRTLAEIREKKYKRVALQFPDSMLGHATRIVEELKSGRKTSEPEETLSDGPKEPTSDSLGSDDEPLDAKYFILGDTSYGACCVDEIAAEHANADVVVHYGRSCLSPTSRIPAIYVFTQENLDVDRLVKHFTAFYEDIDQKIILMADVMYQHHLPYLRDTLKNSGYSRVFLADIVHDPSSPLPNRTVPKEVLDDPTALKQWQLFHISDPPEALLLTLSSRVGDVQIYTSSYTAGDTYNIVEPSAVRALNRRYGLLTSVNTVPIFGILINTLSVRNYLHIVEHVKSQILAAGKKSYTFVVGKINPAKIANFSEIGAWVVIGCWESSLIDSKEFWKPLITPFELELALKSDKERVWLGEWSSDFQRVLETRERPPVDEDGGQQQLDDGRDANDQPIEGNDFDDEPESAPPEFDLRSGRYISQSRPMKIAPENTRNTASGDGTSVKTLALRAKGDIVAVGGEASPGAEYLQSKRSWKGLGSDFEIAYEEEGGAIEQGRSGIARGYRHGEAENRS